MLQSAFVNSAMHPRSIALPLRIILLASAAIVLSFVPYSIFGQEITVKRDPKAAPLPAKPKEESEPKPAKKVDPKEALKNPTAEQIAESVVLIYAFPGGRPKLNQIRKTEMERGKIVTTAADGQVTNANYQRWATRGETPGKEKIRLDQELP